MFLSTQQYTDRQTDTKHNTINAWSLNDDIFYGVHTAVQQRLVQTFRQTVYSDLQGDYFRWLLRSTVVIWQGGSKFRPIAATQPTDGGGCVPPEMPEQTFTARYEILNIVTVHTRHHYYAFI